MNWRVINSYLLSMIFGVIASIPFVMALSNISSVEDKARRSGLVAFIVGVAGLLVILSSKHFSDSLPIFIFLATLGTVFVGIEVVKLLKRPPTSGF